MAGLLSLPPECIILVLLSLPPQEIVRCKLVSRALWTVVNGSPILQYLLELDSLGFVAPRIVSKNLSLEEKIQMLRKSRRKIVVDAYDTIPVPLDWQGHNVLYFGYTHVSFHLRSLQTGLAHPDACLPAVVYDGEPDQHNRSGLRTLRIEIIGHRIAYLREHALSTEPMSRIIIWAWTSGQVLTSTNLDGVSFEFLSENVFIVATPVSHDYDSDPPKKPALMLYTSDGVPPGGSARLSATLNFPMRSSNVALHQTKLGPFTQPSFWYYGIPINVTSPNPPTIYDLPPDSAYLAFRVSFFRDSTPKQGNLFIHVSSLLALASALDTQPSREGVSIPWSKWKSTTTWVGPSWTKGLRSQYGPAIFGHLVAYIHPGEQPSSWKAEVHDLRKVARTIGSFFGNPYKPLKHDSLVKSFQVPFEIIPQRREEYMGLWDNSVDVMLDGEHVIILRRSSEGVGGGFNLNPMYGWTVSSDNRDTRQRKEVSV
ncbi:hypothetical protein RSOLAG22IIIB_07800 [Rhizoctonia solani]|uniref:F-box domain-containing protein n=1 Tax=Rhizoctonia solani TaxID=456999 RepID=A0A0K6FPW2_9AGAM|nr:hypothetical protein RSOLAG22IIIB_07800 [Rhizoctonia solani]